MEHLFKYTEPSIGRVSIDGADVLAMDYMSILAKREQMVAMVFQHFGLLLHRIVLENTAWGS